MMTITERLKKIIAEELDINAKSENIRDDVGLLENGIGMDSVAIMEFISIIEAQFGFQFSDAELSMEPFQNLKALSAFIATKINHE